MSASSRLRGRKKPRRGTSCFRMSHSSVLIPGRRRMIEAASAESRDALPAPAVDRRRRLQPAWARSAEVHLPPFQGHSPSVDARSIDGWRQAEPHPSPEAFEPHLQPAGPAAAHRHRDTSVVFHAPCGLSTTRSTARRRRPAGRVGSMGARRSSLNPQLSPRKQLEASAADRWTQHRKLGAPGGLPLAFIATFFYQINRISSPPNENTTPLAETSAQWTIFASTAALRPV